MADPSLPSAAGDQWKKSGEVMAVDERVGMLVDPLPPLVFEPKDLCRPELPSLSLIVFTEANGGALDQDKPCDAVGNSVVEKLDRAIS